LIWFLVRDLIDCQTQIPISFSQHDSQIDQFLNEILELVLIDLLPLQRA